MQETFLAKPDDAEAQLQALVFSFLERMRDEKLITSDLVSSAVRQEPDQYVRLWNAIRPLYANFNTSASLREYGILDFDAKGVESALRISPHYYNTVGEIDLLIDALGEVQRS